MKKLITMFVCVILTTGIAVGQEKGVKWETDMSKGIDASIKSGKPMLLFFTGSDWCGWCKKLQREVFFTPEFEKWATENVVLMELDFPRRTAISEELRKQNSEMQQMFGVRGYPTIWFVNPTMNKETNQVNFSQIGKTGYVAGGPPGWIGAAEKILAESKN
ncbi:MAG: protein disulfide-isomerase [Granulosicoccus sp.]|jgi:protein disulfide-isomerase